MSNEPLTLEVIQEREEYQSLSKNAQASSEYAEKLRIKNPEDEKKALAAATKIRGERDRGDAIRKFFTDPLNEQVKKINALFQPNIKALGAAYDVIREKLAGYQDEVARKAEAKKAETMAKIEAGDLSVEKGVKKIENIVMPEKTVRTEEATVSYKTEYVIEVEDITKLPADYMIPDFKKIQLIGEALAKAKQSPIAGTKVIEKKTPIIRRNQ